MTTPNDPEPQKLNCRDIQRDLTAYLKGGLPAGTQDAFRRHLLTCAACAQAVQEARTFEAELQLEARQARRAIPPLSPAASAQIQEQVYRKMRRALWFQRSLNVAQRLGALAVVLIFLVGALLLFNPWRQQLATLGTAQPAGDPAESVPAGVRDGEPPPPPPVEAPPEPTATAPPAPSPTPRPAPDTEASRPDPAAARPPIVARETPLEAALAIVDAAISADDLQFALVMERAQPLPEASFRVWRRLERCQGVVAAADLDYRVMVHRGRFASVYVSNAEGRYLGDVKMWLARDGVWYLTSINYSSFTALKHGCPP